MFLLVLRMEAAFRCGSIVLCFFVFELLGFLTHWGNGLFWLRPMIV
jgi:hypothetical protein